MKIADKEQVGRLIRRSRGREMIRGVVYNEGSNTTQYGITNNPINYKYSVIILRVEYSALTRAVV